MNAYGEIRSERALGKSGEIIAHGPSYKRSGSLKDIGAPNRFQLRACWTKKEEVREGHLTFLHDDDKGCIQRRKDFGMSFKGVFLDKICTEINCANKFGVIEEFYPFLKRMLQKTINWGSDFSFHGLATYTPKLMEWAEQTFKRYEHTLRQANIYGLVAISRFPYTLQKDVWRAFCELWGPLTNTLHHGGGELGISLNDLKHIGGLPILGDPYEEFIPLNEQLCDEEKLPATVLELLQVHADLCHHFNTRAITWHNWGDQIYFGFGEDPVDQPQKKQRPKKKSSNNILPRMKPPSKLSISDKGELAAFLAHMLSRFVFPQVTQVVRPETFVMACLMAEGKRISLDPSVLGHIYHQLNKMATHPTHTGRAGPSLGIHFVIGWMAKYFPDLYRCRPESDFPEDYPRLAYYAGVNGKSISIHAARLILRHSQHIAYRRIPFGGMDDLEDVNVEGISEIDFECLLCIRSSVLLVKIGSELILEPYFPNRFARQLGFDQAVPSNSLKFNCTLRIQRSLGDIASCFAHFFSMESGALFSIPRYSYRGTCTWSYYTWWVITSAPYLRQSVHKISMTLNPKEAPLKEHIYIITNMRSMISGLKGAVRISEACQSSCGSKDSGKLSQSSDSFTTEPAHPDVNLATGKRRMKERSPNDDINPKRARYPRSNSSDESSADKTAGYTDIPVSELVFHEENIASTMIESSLHMVKETNTAIITLPEDQTTELELELLSIVPVEFVPNSLKGLFFTSTPEFVRRAMIEGVKAVVEITSKLQFSHNPESTRAEIIRHLEALRIIAKAAEISDICMSWITSQVHELLDSFHTITELEKEITGVPSSQTIHDVSICDANLATHEAILSQLQEKSLSIQAREEEILELEAKLQKMKEDLSVDKEALEKSISETKKHIQLNKAKKQDLEETMQVGQAKVEGLNLKRAYI